MDSGLQSNPEGPPAPLAGRDLGVLGLLLLVGLAVRLVGAGEQPLWLDEATTAAFAARPLPQAITSEIHHPPLHYALTHAALEAFSPEPGVFPVAGITDDVVRGAAASNVLMRLPALLAGLALIPALAFFARGLARREHARAAFHLGAGLTALSPFAVAMSQEARNYALYMLLAVLATHVFFRLLRPEGGVPRAGAGRLALYSLLSLLLMYTHHVAALVLLAHEVLFWRETVRDRRAGRTPAVSAGRWLTARVASALVFLPWMFWVLGQVSSGAASFEARHWVGSPAERIPYSLFRFLAGYGIGPENADAMGLSAWERFREQGPPALAIMAPFVVPLLLGFGRSSWRSGRRGALTWVLLFPYVVLLPLSPWVKMIHERYLCFQCAFLLAVMALGLARLTGRRRVLVAAGVGIASLVGLLANVPSLRAFGGPAGKEPWDQVAAFVREQHPDAIVIAPGFLYLSFDREWLQQGGGRGPQPERRGWPGDSGGREGRDSDGIPLPAIGRRIAIVTSRLGDQEARLLRAFDPRTKVAERWYPQQSGIRVVIFEAAR
jgi:hypothetical protein